MRINRHWDYAALKEIALACDNKQVVRDVAFLENLRHRNPDYGSGACLYVEWTENAFLIGEWQKKALRIWGMGTRKDARGQGLATLLLCRAENAAKERGCERVHTRSLSGADFYTKRGYDVIGMRGGDYLLEKLL